MRFQARRVVLAVMVLVAVLSFAAGAGYAQRLFGTDPLPPTVLSGSDVGFRVEGQRAGKPVGNVVVRVNGQWMEVEFGTVVRQLPAK
jgi:hypothetical protein